MKIINEKGKLFGKVNIIDLIILVAVIAAALVVGINFLRGNTAAPADLLTMEFYSEEVSDFVADKVKVGADGGSVTLASFVPLIIYSYVAGVRKGFLAGALYGILQIVEGGVYFVDVFQLLCDYILAFAFIGLMPVLKKVCKDKKILGVYIGVVVVIFMRFLMHTIAGMYWYAGVPFGEALVTSVLYNGAYMLPELAITVGVMAILLHTGKFNYLSDYITKSIKED